MTDDPAARAAIDRLGSVDVIIYSNGFFSTQNHLRTRMPEQADGGGLKITDLTKKELNGYRPWSPTNERNFVKDWKGPKTISEIVESLGRSGGDGLIRDSDGTPASYIY